MDVPLRNYACVDYGLNNQSGFKIGEQVQITVKDQQLTLGQVLDHYNLKADKNNMLCCPFHKDKTPSFQIYPQTNTFCCFSSDCNAGTGDVIEFIGLTEKCNKHERS